MNEPEVAEYAEGGEERVELVHNRVQDSRRVTRSVTLQTRSVVNLIQDNSDSSDEDDDDTDGVIVTIKFTK